ncbi:AAA family ATPase [Paenarthrobacter ureafaciens]|uniref:AAA family ATPase n=1 Tax=Paenarthrobacter ureafaciens TaxID=37931 RepID=UPI001FB24C3B|nr:AAA family ATPase [Paenarthrobacter ureafaciens]UOD80718.1 AAA family ATPase [Paenarthrobacter ureafaciens]WNZ03377.1 AAA family ATPase [Paenarthrobacter ureafaciens]
MDLREVESRAQLLLAVMSQFGGAIDSNTVISQARRQNPSPHLNPGSLRTDMRAFDLLTKLGCLRLANGGYAYEITDFGRKVLEVGWPSTLTADWLGEWVETERLLEALSERRISDENAVSQLTVQNWRQFSDIDIVFHPRLTILTGANGAGKTTLLNILGPHFNWAAQLLTRQPVRNSSSATMEVGRLLYANGGRSSLLQDSATGVSNTPLQIPEMQAVPGVFINSHRSVSSYQPLRALPPRFSEWDVLQQDFASEIQVRYSGGSSQYSPLYRMKEALVAAAMYAYGNPAVRPNEAAKEVWEGYQGVLRKFLPSSLNFARLEVDESEIIVVTKDAEFPLEAVSGGISAMLELSWQIFLRQRNQPSFTVCLDEPENHLHPELQRTIVPSLLDGFPGVTFIIATHSPLVVTSVQDSFVYALQTDASGAVGCRRVDVNTSATPDETLMSVLGLDTTLPLWAEGRLSNLMEELPASPSTSDLRIFRRKLRELGLDRQFPAAVRSLDVQND